MNRFPLPLLALLVVSLAACRASTAPGSVPGEADDTKPFAGTGQDEIVHFTGTEPFWGGQVAGTALTYSTPENPDGTDIVVSRFAGRGGLSWSGLYEGKRFALAVTQGNCSDGMSDRTYPFVVTLEVSGEQRRGCAWTDQQSFTDPRQQ